MLVLVDRDDAGNMQRRDILYAVLRAAGATQDVKK